MTQEMFRFKVILAGFATFFALLLAGSAFSGCGDDKKTVDLDGLVPWKFYEGASIVDVIEKAKANSKVVCSSTADCPESAAYLIIAQKASSGVFVGQCSGFLIGEDIVGTNSHCIKAAQRNKNSECRNILVFFANTTSGFNNEVHECERIVDASNISVIEEEGIYDPTKPLPQDYAFIRLSSKTTRTPLRISYDGLSDTQHIKMNAINPDKDPSPNFGFTGTLKPRTCSTKFNSSDPLYQHAKTPLVAYTGCEVIPGTSGSAILAASDGTLRAINQGKHESNPIEFGTNMACVIDPVFGDRPLDSHCMDGI